nr:MAG TPA: hypothetical protein [Siphoviridae sp. ctjRi1]
MFFFLYMPVYTRSSASRSVPAKNFLKNFCTFA